MNSGLGITGMGMNVMNSPAMNYSNLSPGMSPGTLPMQLHPHQLHAQQQNGSPYLQQQQLHPHNAARSHGHYGSGSSAYDSDGSVGTRSGMVSAQVTPAPLPPPSLASV